MGNYWSVFMKNFEFFGESCKYAEVDSEEVISACLLIPQPGGSV